jgi:hypothetical protein
VLFNRSIAREGSAKGGKVQEEEKDNEQVISNSAVSSLFPSCNLSKCASSVPLFGALSTPHIAVLCHGLFLIRSSFSSLLMPICESVLRTTMSAAFSSPV